MEEKQSVARMSTDNLPHTLYSADSVRELDQAAIRHGIPGFSLMRRAGRHVLRVVIENWSNPEKSQFFVEVATMVVMGMC